MTASAVVNLLFGGPPTIHVAKKQLSYPLYAADFDPLNHHFLLVGGGGGSSSTGVPNRISLLDTSNRSEIKEVSDIELAPDEDSVVSLAVAESNPRSLLAYAGINSSARDQESGRNEHFRSFSVPLPARRRKDGDELTASTATVTATRPLSRTAIFRAATGPKNECYQRILRLSPPIIEDAPSIYAEREGEKDGGPARRLKKRLTTIASSLAPQNEVVTFPATGAPTATQALSRINLEKAEANDADLTCTNENVTAFALAYCTDTEIFLLQLSDQKGTINSEPISVYETTQGPVGRSKIRALRWLSSRYLILLQNRANRSGVELIVLKVSKDLAQTQVTLIKYLKSTKQAVGLDTCALSKGQDGSQQFVVAVAGQDSSLQIHAIDWIAGTGMTSFKRYADIVDLHSGPITSIRFSNFIPPRLPVSGQTSPQYIRLATVGVDKQVVVQTLPLRPSPATGTGKTMPRYCLIAGSDTGSFLYNLLVGVITLNIALFIVLSFLEFRGAIPQILGATKYLPHRFQEQYGRAYPYEHGPPGPVVADSMPDVESIIDRIKLSEATPFIKKLEEVSDRIKMAEATEVIEELQKMQSSIPSMQKVQDTLADLVSRKGSEEHANKAVIIRDLEHLGGEVSAELKREAEIVKEGTLKTWESLSKKDQKTWKAKLKQAGQWTEQQGETVLKGVFFGMIGQQFA